LDYKNDKDNQNLQSMKGEMSSILQLIIFFNKIPDW